MMARVFLLLAFCLGPAVHAAATQVSLLLSHSSVKPGETVTAALRLVSQPGWHTYWRNAGDAGLPTSVQWELPAGVTAGQIQWPVPEKMVLSKLYAYVYEKETLLLVPLQISSGVKPGPLTLKGSVDWLECSEKTCVPADGKVEAKLTVGGESKGSENSARIQSWRERLPKSDPSLTITASWESGDNTSRKLLLEWKPSYLPDSPDFYPYEDSSALGAETEVLEASPGKIRLRKTVKSADGVWPAEVHGIIVNGKDREKRRAFEVAFVVPPITDAVPGSVAAVQIGSSSGPASLLGILALAFLGGLILNVMPCVLPVIALKILGFVNQSREEPRRVRELGLVYMLGVLASFLVLAGGLLAARKAAGNVNWGMQMQNPYFVVGMLVLVTLVALNLWGVFEITLPGQALGSAGELASREGWSGAFYNGILATLLATPCTAPALGAAVGAVLTRPSYIVILTFLMIGFGLALPYVILSWNPRLLKLLPKPGAWMEKFKVAMGFPMAVTAVWLWSFGGRHFGKSGGLWLGIFLVFIALSAWVYGDFVQRGTRRRGLASAFALLILLVGYTYTLEAKLHWRRPQLASANSDSLENDPTGIQWQRWTPERVARARAEGRPVLVDFTADWCVTCQINKGNSIEVDAVQARLKKMNAQALLADFTFKDARIGAEIRSFGRAGVPLVVVYPANPAVAPILLPDGLFTASTLLEALDRAATTPLRASDTRPR